MAVGQLYDLVRRLRRTAAPGQSCGESDADLLGRFVARGDESAFELLVWRHGGAILAVCRRLLRDEHAAEDAFQATFLALSRRGRSIGRRQSVGGWLYRVAFRAALRARSRAGRRASFERPLTDRAAPERRPDPSSAAAYHELRRALDEEVARLPRQYREAFVLRCLSDRTAADAARELGCPIGTVESRLTRARARLRNALLRRGFAPAATGLAIGTVQEAAAGVTVPLVISTVKAAASFAAGTAATVSAPVALAEGVLRSMLLTKIKIAAAVVLTVGALGAGTAGITLHSGARAAGAGQLHARAPEQDVPLAAAKEAPDEAEEVRKAAEKALARLADEAREQLEQLRKAEADARRRADELKAARENAEKLVAELRDQLKRSEAERATLEAKLRDALAEAQVLTKLASRLRDRAELEREQAERVAKKLQEEIQAATAEHERRRGEIACDLTSVDVENRKVLVTLRGTTLRLDAIPVDKDAKFTVSDKECTLGDFKAGMKVALRVETRGKTSVVVQMRGE
jgi:RNA polymerase sigma factor (sigma-70 family)